MSSYISGRSTGGCLTCKQRKKKCDETKPVCLRCLNGDFRCRGYGSSNVTETPNFGHYNTSDLTSSSILGSPLSIFPDGNVYLGPSPNSFNNNLASLPLQYESARTVAWTQANERSKAIPRGLKPDPMTFGNMVSFIAAQHIRLGGRVMFRPIDIVVKDELTKHIAHNITEVKRWSWYLGATITQALFDGYQQNHYVGVIDRFRRQITRDPASTSWGVAAPGLGDRLSCLEDLAHYALMTSDSKSAYALFKLCTPIFLELAAKTPQIWSQSSAISIFHALHAPMYEMRKFVLWDTMSALAFGTIPLLHYDTTWYTLPNGIPRGMILEWVYGCPAEIVVLLAKVNAWRVSRLVDQPYSIPSLAEWKEVEDKVKRWSPNVDTGDDSANVVGRLAVQETWRQAVFIYLYMGMCGVDSSDSRVESSVRQIVQLAGTIEAGSSLEIHLVVPCLIAGAAARQEKHRSLIRSKLQISRNENVWCLRGADFVPVLDGLWHGAGSGGCAVRWEDYVNARCASLSIED